MQLAALGRCACLAALLLGTAAQDALNGTLFRYSHGILNVAFMTGAALPAEWSSLQHA
jgi:hypothetical protein